MVSAYTIMIDTGYNLLLFYSIFKSFFIVLGTKFRALYMQGMHTTPELQCLAFSFYLSKIFYKN